jgi:hypothetical protein
MGAAKPATGDFLGRIPTAVLAGSFCCIKQRPSISTRRVSMRIATMPSRRLRAVLSLRAFSVPFAFGIAGRYDLPDGGAAAVIPE